MRHVMRFQCVICGLAMLVAVISVAAAAQAQEAVAGERVVVRRALAEADGDEGGRDFWIGVQCATPTDTLRTQLKLKPDQGIVVMSVLPDGPAAKAGLERHDVLLSADDHTLSTADDLLKVVAAAQEKELKLAVIRAGEPRTIAVTPAKRAAPAEAGWRALRVVRPGRVVSPKWALNLQHGPSLPDDMTVTITRQGKQPAKISVKQGDKSWEVTEEGLDDLPEEVRKHVEPTVGGLPMATFALPAPEDVVTWVVDEKQVRRYAEQAEEQAREIAGQAEKKAREVQRRAEEHARDAQRAAEETGRKYAERARVEARRMVDEHLEKRLDELNRRMEDLRKTLDSVLGERTAKPATADKSDKPAEKEKD